MDHQAQRRNHKWLALAAIGSASGIAMLLILRSIPMAAETAFAVVIAMVVLKHVALAAAVGSTFIALLQTLKPKLRAHCPLARNGGD